MPYFTIPIPAAWTHVAGVPRADMAQHEQLFHAPVIDTLGTPDEFDPGDYQAFIYQGVLFNRDEASLDAQNGTTIWRCGPEFICFRSDRLNGVERGYTSVLSFINAPTGDIAKEAKFGVNATPSGLFADQANKIALCVVAGNVETGPTPIFKYSDPAFPGFFAYVQSITGYRHWNGSAWADGLPLVYGAGSIPAEAMKHIADYQVVSIVTASPASPSVGQYFLVGTGATGILAGKDNKVAKCIAVGESAELHTYSYPDLHEGDTAWIVAIKSRYEYVNSVWQPLESSKLFAMPPRVLLPDPISVPTGTSVSFTAAPTGGIEIAAPTYKLARTTNRLLIEGRLDVTCDAATQAGVGLLVDGAGSPTAPNWEWCEFAGAATCSIPFQFEVSVGDVASHTYRLRAYAGAAAVTIRRCSYQFKEIRQ